MSKGSERGKRGSEADYKVGYGRPPRKTQFKPGQSGNPTGKPKKVRPRSIKREVQDVFLRPVVIRQGGRQRRTPGIVGLLERALADGLAGDKAAIRFCYRIAEVFGVFQIRDDVKIDFDKLTEEERAICNQGMMILNRAGLLFRYEGRE